MANPATANNTKAAAPPASIAAEPIASKPSFTGTLAEIVAFLDKHRNGTLVTIDSQIEGVGPIPAFAKPSEAPASLTHLIESFDTLRQKLDGKPRFRTGTAEMLNLDSFIQHANRFKSDHSIIFADNRMTSPTLTCVLDYHQQGAAGLPQFGHHRTVYKFPLSKEWKAWMKGNAVVMNQAEFAEFLEDRSLDIIDAPDFVHAAFDAQESDPVKKRMAEANAKLEEISIKLGIPYAGTKDIVALAKGLSLTVESTAQQKVELASGQATITYEEVHRDKRGEKLVVPGLFLIAIPVFEGELPYRMVVRLRYRFKEGSVLWFYQIHRPDLTFDAAFKGATEKVIEGTALPLLIGMPE